MEKWDGHTHTQFCRHGHEAPMERYVERAIELGFTRYSITEHPPLPDRWIDNPALMDELAMGLDEMPAYFDYAWETKRRFADRIEVAVGLELDYLHGRTDFTLELVDRWQSRIEDVVISVHYLPGIGGMRCIDFTSADFQEGLINHYGAMDKVVEDYYDHVEQAIEFAAGLPMRKRLGHINLIEKFRTALPDIDSGQIKRRLLQVIPKLADSGVGIDVNTAGLRVPTCGKPYVPAWFIAECRKAGVDCVYGSDSHKPDHVGYGWDYYEQAIKAAEAE